MSVAWVAVGASVVGTLAGSSASRQATNAASDSNAQALASQEAATRERLAFDKQTYADGAADRQFASDSAREMAGWQREDRIKYNTLQDEQVARGRKYQSSEDRMLRDAEQYDTEGNQELQASKARANVKQAFAQSNAERKRGVNYNPNSGRNEAFESQSRLSEALAEAGAVNNAREQVKTKGYAMKMDALGLGKGLIGNQATLAGLQLSSGNSSVANSMQPMQIRESSGQIMSQGLGNSASGYASLANSRSNSFANASRYGMGVGSSVGQMFGNLGKTAYNYFNPGNVNSPYFVGPKDEG